MEQTETRIGRIVVVVEGITFGNYPGTVTKVLSKPGAVHDEMFKTIGTRRPVDQPNNMIMCEYVAISKFTHGVKRYLNKPAVYEYINDLRLATDEEKKLYRKSK